MLLPIRGSFFAFVEKATLYTQILYLACMGKIATTILVLICWAQQATAQNWDINLLKSINRNETSFKNNYLEACASSVYVLGVGVPLTVSAIGYFKHSKALLRNGLFMAGSVLVSMVVTQSVKRIIDRRRPFATYAFIVKRDDESPKYAMPSGHTSSVFCTATSLALRYRQWYVVVPAYLYAGSVAWARMYQGVHYPSDVLVGALVGAGSAWLGYHLQKKWERKHQSKKSVIL
jgi:membrane-associated phospholipid phosphatase